MQPSWLRGISLVLSALLIAAQAYSQDAKTPFGPVPVDQRKELASRLIDYTDAFSRRDWILLYDLVSDVNKTLNNGGRMGRTTFAEAMQDGYDSQRLLEFTPIRTEPSSAGRFDIYGCGEIPNGREKPERLVVAVRATREHDAWFFTAWDYFDPRQPCSNLSNPAWKPSHTLRLDFLPQLVCYVTGCTL